jgi:hypothetical protein
VLSDATRDGRATVDEMKMRRMRWTRTAMTMRTQIHAEDEEYKDATKTISRATTPV